MKNNKYIAIILIQSLTLLNNMISMERETSRDFMLNRDEGSKILTHAKRFGHFQSIRDISENKEIDINKQDEFGNTALIEAIMINAIDMVKSLLSTPGINIDLQDNYGNTALMIAVQMGSKEIVQLLLDANANINIKDKRKNTALLLAKINSKDRKYKEDKEILKLIKNHIIKQNANSRV
ncbi:MAG: ankyrin repeat domain-containing protein [Novosphingobium sp.]|nr:ankyrin repeat domain-containing protein [Novosphingobium sp.]